MTKTNRIQITAVLTGVFALGMGMFFLPALAETGVETESASGIRADIQIPYAITVDSHELEWTEIEGKKVLAYPGRVAIPVENMEFHQMPEYVNSVKGEVSQVECDFDFKYEDYKDKIEFDEKNQMFMPGLLIEELPEGCSISTEG